MDIQIGTINARKGEKKSGIYRVPEIGHPMPVTVINGAGDGKIALITSGIHGCESVGIQTAIELALELSPEKLSGAVILIHPVNTSGFRTNTPALVPEARKNLNRLFPGDRHGGFGERIAYALTHEFQSLADFYMDLHGGDQNEELKPMVFYPGVAEAAVTQEAKRVAGFLNVKYMLKSGAITGGYNSAAKRGLPSMLIERGGQGLWSAEEVALYKNDVLSALWALGIYPECPNAPLSPAPRNVYDAVYLESGYDGCWYPSIRAGDAITQGQLLGEIRDFFGQVLARYEASIDGVVLYRACSLSVREGTELIAMAKVAGL